MSSCSMSAASSGLRCSTRLLRAGSRAPDGRAAQLTDQRSNARQACGFGLQMRVSKAHPIREPLGLVRSMTIGEEMMRFALYAFSAAAAAMLVAAPANAEVKIKLEEVA